MERATQEDDLNHLLDDALEDFEKLPGQAQITLPTSASLCVQTSNQKCRASSEAPNTNKQLPLPGNGKSTCQAGEQAKTKLDSPPPASGVYYDHCDPTPKQEVLEGQVSSGSKLSKKTVESDSSKNLGTGSASNPFDPSAMLGMENIPALTNLLMSALQGDETAVEEMDRLAKETESQHPPPTSGDFESALQEAMKSMAENADNLQTEPSDDDLARLIQEFGDLSMPLGVGDDAGGGLEGMGPAMNNIMGMLLSKEIFYPAIKEMTGRFPEWLETHGSGLSEEELKRYQEQLKLMESICQVYEDPNLSEQTCTERVQKAMEEMQHLGFPPGDISGNLPVPNSNQLTPDKCCLM